MMGWVGGRVGVAVSWRGEPGILRRSATLPQKCPLEEGRSGPLHIRGWVGRVRPGGALCGLRAGPFQSSKARTYAPSHARVSPLR